MATGRGRSGELCQPVTRPCAKWTLEGPYSQRPSLRNTGLPSRRSTSAFDMPAASRRDAAAGDGRDAGGVACAGVPRAIAGGTEAWMRGDVSGAGAGAGGCGQSTNIPAASNPSTAAVRRPLRRAGRGGAVSRSAGPGSRPWTRAKASSRARAAFASARAGAAAPPWRSGCSCEATRRQAGFSAATGAPGGRPRRCRSSSRRAGMVKNCDPLLKSPCGQRIITSPPPHGRAPGREARSPRAPKEQGIACPS